MKNKSSKSSRKPASSHKTPRAAPAKRCECCGDAPCSCPSTHLHKR